MSYSNQKHQHVFFSNTFYAFLMCSGLDASIDYYCSSRYSICVKLRHQWNAKLCWSINTSLITSSSTDFLPSCSKNVNIVKSLQVKVPPSNPQFHCVDVEILSYSLSTPFLLMFFFFSCALHEPNLDSAIFILTSGNILVPLKTK